MTAVPHSLPLTGVRVLDLTDGTAGMCGRLLADLGAEVLLIEPLGGCAARSAEPVVGGVGVGFLATAANKRSVRLDLDAADGRARLRELAAAADVLLDGRPSAAATHLDVSREALRAINPGLVITSITDYGRTGPYRDRAATDGTHLALAGLLSRSGLPGREPLLPPGRLAGQHAAAQALWVTVAALWQARRTGRGDHVDVSVHEATLAAFDAAFGIGGTAAAGATASDAPPGRPDAGFMYPIFDCADGRVRLCLLAPRQWAAMFAWLGEPAEFADPRYAQVTKRFRDRDRLYLLIAALFADGRQSELVAEAQRRGVPLEGVNTAGRVLTDEHFRFRSAFASITLPDGATGQLPSGVWEFDGVRVGYREPLREAGSEPGFADTGADTGLPTAIRGRRGGPLDNLRVLDLGVIVVGAETGRLFADLGADVIKIESRAFADGSRQSAPRGTIGRTLAWGHRGKRSIGIDLRSDRGRQLFLELVAVSDVVLSNFKPGTLESLGLAHPDLAAVNPCIVVVESSALGPSGPASRRMGYGPLVRAATGLSELWRYPDEDGSYCDAVTVYPDHVAARIGAAGGLAALMAVARTGAGATVSVSQAEVMLTQFSAEFLRESVAPGTLVPAGNVDEFCAPSGVYPCAGEDQWCVVVVDDDDRWRALCALLTDGPGGHGDGSDGDDLDPGLDLAGRLARRADIDRVVATWTALRTPDEVMQLLQDAGVPAAAMRRARELPDDPQLAHRGYFGELDQPGLGVIPAERTPALFDVTVVPSPAAAPLQGQHTREIATDLLGLAQDAVEQLMADGVLEDVEQPEERA